MNGNTSSSNNGLYIDIDDGFILMRESDSSRFIKLNVLASGGSKTNSYSG
jgi:hypothetical protein